jgi:acetate CoA/acetoacetate CoA-transferase beta subunit
MDDKTLIAERAALELKDGNLVNLGIGLPTLIPGYMPPGMDVYFQSENGIIGMAPMPGAGMEEPSLIDAGGGFVGAIPGTASIDSCLSFGMIRGSHLDLTILGGLQVD